MKSLVSVLLLSTVLCVSSEAQEVMPYVKNLDISSSVILKAAQDADEQIKNVLTAHEVEISKLKEDASVKVREIIDQFLIEVDAEKSAKMKAEQLDEATKLRDLENALLSRDGNNQPQRATDSVAEYSVQEGAILPLEKGTKPFSNRADQIVYLDGLTLTDQHFWLVQVEMRNRSRLNIEVTKTGVVYVAVCMPATNVPRNWVATESVFTDTVGRLYRVHKMEVTRTGNHSIRWANTNSGTQILLPR